MVAAKKFGSPSEGAAEGGCGGNSAAPERSVGAKRGEPKLLAISLLIFENRNSKGFLFSFDLLTYLCHTATGTFQQFTNEEDSK